MNHSVIICLQLFVIIVTYVFCTPTEEGLCAYSIAINKINSIHFGHIPDQFEKYLCYDDPESYGGGDYTYSSNIQIIYRNPNAVFDNIPNHWMNYVSFTKTRIKIITLYDKKLTAFIIAEDVGWQLVNFEFESSVGADTIYNLMEIRDNQILISENVFIRLRKLIIEEENSYDLTVTSNSLKIYSETFDPNPNGEYDTRITLIIFRSLFPTGSSVLHFVLSKGDFWISQVKDNYLALFIENDENWPFVIAFVNNGMAEAYRRILIKWTTDDKRNVPFPENILRFLPF